MDDAQHDSEPAPPEDDPLQRIAALERRVAVLTRENERLETFLAILRHKTFGRSSEKMSPDQLSLLGTTAPDRAGRCGAGLQSCRHGPHDASYHAARQSSPAGVRLACRILCDQHA